MTMDLFKKQVVSVRERKKPFQCNICGILFTSNTTLSKHIEIHHRYDLSEANTNKEKFLTKENHEKRSQIIDAWIKVSENKNSEGTIVENSEDLSNLFMKVPTKDSLQKARDDLSTEIHIKLSKCTICLALFKNNQEMKIHMSTVHKQFSICNVCLNVFSCKNDLKHHIEISHGDKKQLNLEETLSSKQRLTYSGDNSCFNKPSVCSKLAIFKKIRQTLKVLLRP